MSERLDNTLFFKRQQINQYLGQTQWVRILPPSRWSEVRYKSRAPLRCWQWSVWGCLFYLIPFIRMP